MFTFNKSLAIAASLAIGVVLPAISEQATAQTIYLERSVSLEKGARAMHAGDIKTAVRYFRRAARAGLAKDHEIFAQTNICALDYLLTNFKTAKKACTKAIRLDRRNWRALYNRGHVYQALNNFEKAEADYKRAGRLHSKDGRIEASITRLASRAAQKFAENSK